ncbi:MAG: hypothetical protein Q4C96_02085 [Planctomycetia bacterium]|nr:hypothetical protein [Planctomycetia bacterium]
MMDEAQCASTFKNENPAESTRSNIGFCEAVWPSSLTLRRWRSEIGWMKISVKKWPKSSGMFYTGFTLNSRFLRL